MTQTLVATPDPPTPQRVNPDPVVIREETFMQALGALVELYGDERSSAYENIDHDGLVFAEAKPNDVEGLVGRIIRYHGVSGRKLRALGDFMVLGDFNCTPSGLFHLAGDTRQMAMMVESLEELGHTWGSILRELEEYVESRG